MTDGTPEPRLLYDVQLIGDIVLDPAYAPPWPGAGITHVDGQPVSDAQAQAT